MGISCNGPYITEHAIDRYIERVETVDRDKARAAMEAASRCIEVAAKVGCNRVILGNGGRLVLDGMTVVTVLPKHVTKVRNRRVPGAAND